MSVIVASGGSKKINMRNTPLRTGNIHGPLRERIADVYNSKEQLDKVLDMDIRYGRFAVSPQHSR